MHSPPAKRPAGSRGGRSAPPGGPRGQGHGRHRARPTDGKGQHQRGLSCLSHRDMRGMSRIVPIRIPQPRLPPARQRRGRLCVRAYGRALGRPAPPDLRHRHAHRPELRSGEDRVHHGDPRPGRHRQQPCRHGLWPARRRAEAVHIAYPHRRLAYPRRAAPAALRTQRRKVSAVRPILPAIEAIAVRCDASAPTCSNTIRTARADLMRVALGCLDRSILSRVGASRSSAGVR